MKNVDNTNTYTDIALSRMFVQNPKEAKTTQNILHRRKGLNLRKHVKEEKNKKRKSNHKEPLCKAMWFIFKNNEEYICCE